jgi:hypothetical protein
MLPLAVRGMMGDGVGLGGMVKSEICHNQELNMDCLLV